jgi:hypothetical protein
MSGDANAGSHDIVVRVSENRFRQAVDELSVFLAELSEEEVLGMSGDDVRLTAARIVRSVLAEELCWLETEGIPFHVLLTANDRIFVFAFEREGDAMRFRAAFPGRIVPGTEMPPPLHGLLH